MSNCYDIEYKDNYFDQCTRVKTNYRTTTAEDVKKRRKEFKEFSDGVLERFDEIIKNFDEEYNYIYGKNKK